MLGSCSISKPEEVAVCSKGCHWKTKEEISKTSSKTEDIEFDNQMVVESMWIKRKIKRK